MLFITFQTLFALPQASAPVEIGTISDATGIEMLTQDVSASFSMAELSSKSPAGKTLMENKAMLNAALGELKITDKKTIALMFAIGFIETNHLSALEALSQNKTNPKSGLSTNFGFLNLNLEAIQKSDSPLPSTLEDISSLNANLTVDTQDAMKNSIDIANRLMTKFTKSGFVNQHRGGQAGLDSTGKMDCGDLDCKGYRNHAAARAYAIIKNPELLTNNVRLQGQVAPE